MSSSPGIQLLRNRYVFGGLILLVVVLSSLAALRFLKTEEVARETERVARVEQVEQELAQEAVVAGQAQAERARVAREEAERAEAEEQARLALLEQERQQQALARKQAQDRRDAEARRQRQSEQEAARRKQLAEQQARQDAEREEAKRRKAKEDEDASLAEGLARQEELRKKAEAKAAEQASADETATKLEAFKAQQDETPTVETESTIDGAREVRGWKVSGDLRPIVEYDTEEDENGVSTDEGWSLGIRARLGVVWAPLRRLHLGARLAGICFTNDCNVDIVREPATSAGNGLAGGEATFDQFYLHWFRTGKFDLAVGRLQTRFVLRGGVYAKSLDRNDSNNVNVTWTDGLHATYRIKRDYEIHLVLQHNVEAGSSSIRRGALDFSDPGAEISYFAGSENIQSLGPMVQRAIDISYLPDSLLKDGDVDGRRGDYWAPVGRVAFRWPNRREGLRLRAGTEVGYAPETQTCLSANLGCSGDVSGLAWNIVASAMDFAPRQSIGINYARTGPGWYLSPQYGPNEELFEIRHQWNPEHWPLLEARVRWRRELEQQVGAAQRANDFDFYLRLTWQFKIKDF